MLISRELACWTGDKEAQRATQAAIEACALESRGGAVHARFCEIFGALERPTAAQVVQAVETAFADHSWLGRFVDTLAAAMRSDPFLNPPFATLSSDIHSGLLVYEDDHVSIAAGVTRADALAAKKNVARGRVSVGFTGYVSLLKFIRAGGAFLSFWEAPPIGAGFSAAAAGQCRRTGGRVLEDSELLVCDGRYQSYVIEHASANLLILQATIKADQAPVSVEYDAVSHGYVGCSATSDVASRIQMISTLLRKLGDPRAYETIVPMLDHPDFFVRWHVMRELLGVDAAAALPHLEHMASSDPHPDNRLAAAKVLARFDISDRKAA